MRFTTRIAALCSIALPAAAQTPASPVTRARPRNIMGTGQCLPNGNSVNHVERGGCGYFFLVPRRFGRVATMSYRQLQVELACQ